MTLQDHVNRLTTEFVDYLRFNRTAGRLASVGITAMESLPRPRRPGRMARSLERLSAAARISVGSRWQTVVERMLSRRLETLASQPIAWDECFPDSANSEVYKAIILKRPQGPAEKGVILVSFENQWLRLLRHADVAALARDYHLVLAPSWSPPHDLAFLLAAKLWPGPLFHLMSNFNDAETFRRIAPSAVGSRLLASSWVHPDIFRPYDDVEKEFDIVVLANFSCYKRHFALFKMLGQMPRRTKVLLLGKSWSGRTRDTIMREAAWYGVQQSVTIREGLPDDEMIRAMQSAKIGFLPSLNEGSCVAVMEFLFCNVPMALFEDAIVGSAAYINSQTGVLLDRRRAAEQMTEFIRNHDRYRPRRWVEDNNLSCFGSTEVLNADMRSWCLANGERWTCDILPHHWRPNPSYVDRDHAADMAPLYGELRARYGVNTTPPVWAVPEGCSRCAERLATAGR